MNAEALCELINREFRLNPSISVDAPVLSSGRVDSLRFAELVMLVEQAFAVTLELSDLGYDNFDTPRQMTTTALETAR
jgi:acyl carrier protein